MNNWKHFDILKYKTKEGKSAIKQYKNETIDDLINKL